MWPALRQLGVLQEKRGWGGVRPLVAPQRGGRACAAGACAGMLPSGGAGRTTGSTQLRAATLQQYVRSTPSSSAWSRRPACIHGNDSTHLPSKDLTSCLARKACFSSDDWQGKLISGTIDNLFFQSKLACLARKACFSSGVAKWRAHVAHMLCAWAVLLKFSAMFEKACTWRRGWGKAGRQGRHGALNHPKSPLLRLVRLAFRSSRLQSRPGWAEQLQHACGCPLTNAGLPPHMHHFSRQLLPNCPQTFCPQTHAMRQPGNQRITANTNKSPSKLPPT